MIAERASSVNFEKKNSCTRSFEDFIHSETLTTIKIAPRDSVKYLEAHPDSGPFRSWVGRVYSLLNQFPLSPELEEEFTSEVVGLPAIRPLIEKIAAEAEASGFKADNPKTQTFKTLLDQNIGLIFRLCPAAAKNVILRFPTEGPFSRLESHLMNHLGEEAVVAFLESVLDGWFLNFDYTVVGHPKTITKPRLFGLVLKEDENGNYLQTPESQERRSSLQSVEGVAEAFVKLFVSPETTEEVRSVLSHLKVNPEERPKTSTSPLLEPLAHVGAYAAPFEPCKWPEDFSAENFISGKLTDKCAMLNPYIIFRLLLTHQKPEAPFQIASLPRFLYLHNMDSSLVVYEPSTRPVKEYEYAIPLRYVLDFASRLLRVFVPHFRESGNHRVATELCSAVKNILSGIHSYTSNCQFNPDRNRYASKNVALDALVLEAAEKVGEEMIIPGFSELVEEVMMASNASVAESAMSLAKHSWQLKWRCQQ